MMNLTRRLLWPALLLAPPVAFAAAAPPSRPKVIIILADDLGYGDLSCFHQDAANPDSPILTPHLDSLAAQGVKFTQAYASQMCSPSRASLLTGKYSQRFGFYENQDAAVGLPKSERTLAELLAPHGYATACLGKWHVGHQPGCRPLDRGFSRFYGFLGAAHDYFKPSVGTDTEGAIHEGSFVYDQDAPASEMKYLTDQLAEVAIDFIDRSQRRGEPFFIYLPFNAPHGPAQPQPELAAEFARFPTVKNPARTNIRAMIDALDRNVGRMLRELFLRGLDRNTLVVFASDNGGNEYEFADGIRTVQHNGGLRGRKFLLWEGGIRVPLILRWKGTLPEGVTCSGTCHLFDVFATVAAAAGVAIPAECRVDAVNLLPFARGEKSGNPHDVIHATLPSPQDEWAVRAGEWKLIEGQDSLRPGSVTKTGNPGKSPRVAGLYNLAQDPGERKNLLADHPEIVARLRALHQTFARACAPNLAAGAGHSPAP